ncbi:MAG: hypothetical protein P4L71_04810 [Acetobacteraceae bacterium]|nr:hypothetical protein [Acetobacteraceae bacterium]
MSANVAQPAEGTMTPDLTQIGDDLAALKHDLAELLGHVRSGAVNGAGDAADAVRSSVGQLSRKTRTAYDDLSAQAECTAKAIGGQIEERPVTSLLIAFGVGVLASRLLSR